MPLPANRICLRHASFSRDDRPTDDALDRRPPGCTDCNFFCGVFASNSRSKGFVWRNHRDTPDGRFPFSCMSRSGGIAARAALGLPPNIRRRVQRRQRLEAFHYRPETKPAFLAVFLPRSRRAASGDSQSYNDDLHVLPVRSNPRLHESCPVHACLHRDGVHVGVSGARPIPDVRAQAESFY